jgi:hypothetical protein
MPVNLAVVRSQIETRFGVDPSKPERGYESEQMHLRVVVNRTDSGCNADGFC